MVSYERSKNIDQLSTSLRSILENLANFESLITAASNFLENVAI